MITKGKFADYLLEFRTILAGSGLDNTIPGTTFCRGLQPEILTEPLCHKEQVTLDLLVNLMIHLGNQVPSHTKKTQPLISTAADPMQELCMWLSEQESTLMFLFKLTCRSDYWFTIAFTTIENPDTNTLSTIPKESQASSLPPHKPYDCKLSFCLALAAMFTPTGRTAGFEGVY
ncbi:uncharacterized [Tachysurus ichikawai]